MNGQPSNISLPEFSLHQTIPKPSGPDHVCEPSISLKFCYQTERYGRFCLLPSKGDQYILDIVTDSDESSDNKPRANRRHEPIDRLGN